MLIPEKVGRRRRTGAQMDGDAADIEFEIGRAPNRKCGDLLQWSRGTCRTFHSFGRPRIPSGDEREQQDMPRPPTQ
jgi:hypothetical protein